jgi:hypothetical protein
MAALLSAGKTKTILHNQSSWQPSSMARPPAPRICGAGREGREGAREEAGELRQVSYPAGTSRCCGPAGLQQSHKGTGPKTPPQGMAQWQAYLEGVEEAHDAVVPHLRQHIALSFDMVNLHAAHSPQVAGLSREVFLALRDLSPTDHPTGARHALLGAAPWGLPGAQTAAQSRAALEPAIVCHPTCTHSHGIALARASPAPAAPSPTSSASSPPPACRWHCHGRCAPAGPAQHNVGLAAGALCSCTCAASGLCRSEACKIPCASLLQLASLPIHRGYEAPNIKKEAAHYKFLLPRVSSHAGRAQPPQALKQHTVLCSALTTSELHHSPAQHAQRGKAYLPEGALAD